MKKNILTAVILGGLTMTACVKESANEQLGIPENAILLTTEGFTGNGTKTSVSAESVQWVTGDEVTINGSNYTVTVSDSKAYIDGGSIAEDALYGYYACGSVTNGSTTSPTVTVQPSYSSHYDGGRQVIALPMVAYSAEKGNNIKFQHVTAAVNVRVKNQISGKTLVLDRVVVSSTAYKLSGTATVTLNANAAPTVDAQSGSGSVTVSFSDAPTIAYDAILDVQVPILPIGTNGNLTVEVYTHDNGRNSTYIYTKTVAASGLNSGAGLPRNVMLTAGCLVNTTTGTTTTGYMLLSAATTSDYGKVVCAAGHLHAAKTAVPAGCTAVGIIGKVTETGHGLILALQNATSQNWNTINDWTSETTYAGTTLKLLPNDAARGGNLTSYTTLGATTVSNWAVAQKSDYEAIFINLGSTTGDYDGTTYDANVNAYITTGIGGSAISGNCWPATEYNGSAAWTFNSSYWNNNPKTLIYSVRPVLAF